jgi:hypothetical protein
MIELYDFVHELFDVQFDSLGNDALVNGDHPVLAASLAWRTATP